jgi:cell division transport system ATP-binding protein
MATHEAAIVDQMQRRVIELVGGQIVRDERHGGYGYTASIPVHEPTIAKHQQYTPEPEPVPVPEPPAPQQAAEPVRLTRPASPPPVVREPVPDQAVADAPTNAQPAVPEPVPGSRQRRPAALPDQLSLAERLGLRAPGEDDDLIGEQDVGPVK